MKKGVSCDFIVDVKSKVTWWSGDEVTAQIQVFQNLPGNRHGCEANSTKRISYESDTTMHIGHEYEEYESTCMIKYFLTNHNENQIMRLQIYKDGDAAGYLKVSAFALISAVALLGSGLLI